MARPSIGSRVQLAAQLWGAEFRRKRWVIAQIPAGAKVQVLDVGFLTGGAQRQVDVAWKSRIVRVPASDFEERTGEFAGQGRSKSKQAPDELPHWIGAA
jgi:hypothetical protein